MTLWLHQSRLFILKSDEVDYIFRICQNIQMKNVDHKWRLALSDPMPPIWQMIRLIISDISHSQRGLFPKEQKSSVVCGTMSIIINNFRAIFLFQLSLLNSPVAQKNTRFFSISFFFERKSFVENVQVYTYECISYKAIACF